MWKETHSEESVGIVCLFLDFMGGEFDGRGIS